ncbi:MAG: DUF1028 domain-containing protein [Acidobacteriota bacterium]|nr:DUF1028 domain-containing protein [Acidobacteriota bacterium]
MIGLLICCLVLGDPGVVPKPSELAHTYSIVAYDPGTGQLGGAVQSHWFSVGSGVLWVRPGVGVVATQSFTRAAYGPLGLDAMAAGESPTGALERLTEEDEGRAVRQVGFVDAKGRAAGFTGKSCIDYACDRQGKYFSIQANIMLKDTVCAAMEKAFTAAKGPLAHRLMAALEAAQAEGGDLRGRQSAAMVVVSADKPKHAWEGRIVDLRVDDHPTPLKELKRLLAVHDAYEFMNAGDVALEKNKIAEGLKAYGTAVTMLPDRVEPVFWQAYTMVTVGRLDEALPLFKQVFEKEPVWRKMPRRLVKSGLLPNDEALLKKIESQ